jgi:transposase InsO family protein
MGEHRRKVFLIPCWSGEMVSVAFAIDCHDREVPAYVASPRPPTSSDIRTLIDRMRWARFGEATLKVDDAGLERREQRPGRSVHRDGVEGGAPRSPANRQ